MALVIEQKPAYKGMPAGQQLIYVVSEDTGLMTSESLVRINAAVSLWERNNQTGNIHSSTYSSSPNNMGVAIFDFGPVVENYVRAQTNGVLSSQPVGASSFQGNPYDAKSGYHSIHNIDKYCYAPEVVAYLTCTFTIEYLGGGVVQGMSPDVVGENLMILGADIQYVYNGVLYNSDVLSYVDASPNFGYDLDINNYILNDTSAKFLTDMPSTVKARYVDYGTVAFLNNWSDNKFGFNTAGQPDYGIDKMEIKMYDNTGSQISSTLYVENRVANGGWSGIGADPLQGSLDSRQAQIRYLFFGFYPANIRASKASFETACTNGTLASYTVQALAQDGSYCSQLYTVEIINDCLYEPIRLAWLNKHGAWDYYTFTKKSIRSLTSTRTHYEKLDGTWNESFYNLNTSKGGKTPYHTSTTEKITLNTDYMNDTESEWIAQLMTSNKVLIIKDYFTGGGMNIVRRFTEPCTVTDSSFTRKTRVNDKLIQYTFNIEKAHPIRTQKA